MPIFPIFKNILKPSIQDDMLQIVLFCLYPNQNKNLADRASISHSYPESHRVK